jgi:protein-serine/threonine kinase
MAQNPNQSQQQQQQAGGQPLSTGPSSSSSSLATTTTAVSGASGNNSKPSDYVYFDRTTAGFTAEAVPKAKGAQVKLEHFYKVAVEAAIERNTRCISPLVVVAL